MSCCCAWLLADQRDRVRDRPRLNFRKFDAHPAYHLEMPQDAEAEIADLAAIINRLWGAPSGAPQAREVMIVAWDPACGRGRVVRYIANLLDDLQHSLCGAIPNPVLAIQDPRDRSSRARRRSARRLTE